MIFTSVSGHLYDMDFEDSFRNWGSCDPLQLFEAPIIKFVPEVTPKNILSFKNLELKINCRNFKN